MYDNSLIQGQAKSSITLASSSILKSNYNQYSNKFWIAHQNARSLRKNGDDLFAHFASDKILPDILFFSEVWITGDELNMYKLNNFETVDCCNNNYRAGGIVGYVKNGIPFKFNKKNLRSADILQINFNLQNDLFSVICVYRFNFCSIDVFIDEFSNYLNSVHTKNLFVIGDFNIDILKTLDYDSKNYVSMMASFGLKSIVNQPTRITKTSATCIDHIFIRVNPSSKFDIVSELCDFKLSDHFLISLRIGRLPIISHKSSVAEIKMINYNKLNELLVNDQWPLLLESDGNIAFNKFMLSLKHKIEQSSYVINKKPRPKKIKPWMSDNLLNIIQLKNNLLKLLQKKPNNVRLQKRIKSLQTKIAAEIRTTKETYYIGKFDHAKYNLKNQWQLVNEITGKTKDKSKISEILNCNGVRITDPVAIADEFNNFFVEAPIKLKSNISNLNSSVGNSFLFSHTIDSKSAFFASISPSEILSYINSLDNSNACGFDNISNFTLKKISASIAFIIAHIFNLCLQQGIFPDCLKMAVVIPLFKKGNINDVSNYRPISLLSTFSKIFEKCIKARLLLFLNEKSFFASQQYGFTEGSSTEMALSNLINNISSTLNDGHNAAAIFIDLTKAFDTVDHQLLLYKLHCAGVRGILHNWFDCYLKNRMQVVKIANQYSSSRVFNRGVPQGSVLGPILFLIYINSIFYLDLKGSIVGFADDIALSYKCKQSSGLSDLINCDLLLIRSWLDLHYMILSPKSKSMFFKLFGASAINFDIIYHSTDCCNYVNTNLAALYSTCNGICTCIEPVGNFKYLGITLDSRLSFKTHLDNLQKYINSCNRNLYMLRMVGCPKSVLLKFYYGLLQSKLQYGITVWGGVNITSLKPLNVAHNISIRIILKKCRLTTTLPLFRSLNILPLRCLYIFKVLKVFFLRSGNRSVKITKYKLRNCGNCVYSAPRKEHFRKYSSFIGPVIFNKLPDKLKNIKSVGKFLKELKGWLFEIDHIESLFTILI